MPNPISLVDAKATPVTHTLAPQAWDKNGVMRYIEPHAEVSLGDLTLSASYTHTASGNDKVRCVLSKPMIHAETWQNGIKNWTVARTAFADITFTFTREHSLEERQDMVAMVQSLFDPSNTDVLGALFQRIDFKVA